MTNKGRAMIDRGRVVNRFETDNWFIIISEVDNHIKIDVQGKRDHRDRVMWWKQSRRLFPEIRDENDE